MANPLILTPKTEMIVGPSLFGGKATNLYALSKLGIPVPAWICVSAQAFDAVVAPFKATLSNYLTQCDWSNASSVAHTSARIQSLFEGAVIPDNLTAQIREAVEQSFVGDAFLAVRSSALGEDSKKDSYAGQLETYLFVRRTDVVENVRLCWMSAFSPRILSYLNARGSNPLDTRVGVVVQVMVNSETSGVLFTASPHGRLDEMVLVGGFGLGEGIVADLVEADTYRIDRRTQAVRAATQTKESRIVFDESKGHGTCKMAVPLEKRNVSVLSNTQISDLCRLGLTLENHFKTPQDIEWAFDAQGNLYLTQSRPITTIPAGRRRIFDNSNVSESYPGLTKPLTFSFIKTGYKAVFTQTFASLGLASRKVTENEEIFDHLLGYVQGRVFYNLTHWYRMFQLVPGTRKYVEVWEEMMGIQARSDAVNSRSISQSLAHASEFGVCLFHFVRQFVFLPRYMQRFHVRCRAAHADFWVMDHQALTADELAEVFLNMRRRLFLGWEITLLNDGFAFIFSGLVRAILKKAGFDDPNDVFNQLLCGDAQMESVQPVQSLVAMAELVRNEPLLGIALESALAKPVTSKQALAELRAQLQFAEFFKIFDKHVFLYGDRTTEELKLESPSFRSDPRPLVELVLTYARQKVTRTGMLEREQVVRAKVKDALRSGFSGKPLLLSAFHLSLKFARRSIISRENSRFDRTRSYGIVRCLFTEMGQRFFDAGALGDASDIHYLTVEECLAWIAGDSVDVSLKGRVLERQGVFEKWATCQTEERFTTQGPTHLNIIPQKEHFADDDAASPSVLRGTGCSPGCVDGEAVVVRSAEDGKDVNGRILVAEMTDPGWVFMMLAASGLVSEKGSVLSHTAIIGRELGIPTVVGVKDATRRISSGQRLRLDGHQGTVQWIDLIPDTQGALNKEEI